MTDAPGPFATAGRDPDFIIIGAMKAGTTTLYRWLGTHPDIWLPAVKEPNYFSTGWAKGPKRYRSLFAPAGPRTTGEASVGYTDPDRSRTVAERLHATLPAVRLLYLVRHPVDRLRSQFQHQVLRGREQRTIDEVLADPGNPYLARSLYWTCVEPFVDCFAPDQLQVVRFEDLFGGTGDEAWQAILHHLGVAPMPRPQWSHTPTRERVAFTPAMRWLWDAGLAQRRRLVPRPIRRMGRGLFVRRPPPLTGDRVRLPADAATRLWHDINRLEEWLGRQLWPR